MPDLDSEAIEFRAASESFKPVRPLRERDVGTLRILANYQGRKEPTVGATLLLGRDRERRCPYAWIQAGRCAGRDRTRIVDRADCRGWAGAGE